MTEPHLDKCFTVSELAKRWRCRRTTVRSMVRCGALSAIQIGDKIRVTPEAVRQAEQGQLAVRPRRVCRSRRKVDPEIEAILRE